MKFVKALLLVLGGALLTTSLVARNPRGVGTGAIVGHANYVGANLGVPSYYNPSIPCLNVLNCAGQNGYSVWEKTTPAENGGVRPGGDGLLALDVNGYPTSMTPTASTGVTAGAAYTAITIPYIFTNMPALAPGQTLLYPTGSYTLSCSGADYSITMSGDAVSAGSGLTLACSHTTPASLVFNVITPTSGGFGLAITSIGTVNAGAISLSVVQTAYLASYQAGEYFHPLFKAMLSAAGYSRYRFMEWSNVWNSNRKIVFSGDLPASSLGGNLNATYYPDGWDLPTGTYTMQFQNGDVRSVTATWHSAALSWTPATSSDNPFTAYYVGQAWMSLIQSWAQRPTKNTLAWTNPGGVPIEIQWALVQEMNVDWWANTFLASGTSGMSDYGTNGANYYNTQMATLVQTLTAGTAWLSAGHKIYIEVQNEVWNGAETDTYRYAEYTGFSQLAGSVCTSGTLYYCGQEFLGVMTAAVSDTWKAVWGTTPFNNTIVMSMGGFAAAGTGDDFLNYAMTAPDYVALGGGRTAPYTHGIKSMHFSPYMDRIPAITSQDQYTWQPVAITFTGAPSGTAATTTANVTCGGYPCTFLVTFSDSEVRSVTIASATSALTWSGTLSGGPTTAAVYGDVAAILAAANPLNTMFGLMYSNTYGGITYPGMASAGFVGSKIANMTSVLSGISSYAWYASMQLEFYEIGTNFVTNGFISGTYQTNFTNLIVSMDRDARMAYVLHDPTHALSSNPGYLDSLKTFTPHVGNWHFGDAYPPSIYGEWGIFESALQPLTGGTSPPKAQAMKAFIQ